MPGLKLTLPQAARLFGLRAGTCHAVLEALVKDGALRRSPEQRYEWGRPL
jgi:DNA-binding IclR family transcriptional regulator